MQRVINPDPLGTLAEYGLTKQQIRQARQIRDAEKADPGIVRRTVDRAGSKLYKGSGYAAPSRSGQRATLSWAINSSWSKFSGVN